MAKQMADPIHRYWKGAAILMGLLGAGQLQKSS
jgi:hypothetical protein